jgi:hypothetical protein
MFSIVVPHILGQNLYFVLFNKVHEWVFFFEHDHFTLAQAIDNLKMWYLRVGQNLVKLKYQSEKQVLQDKT